MKKPSVNLISLGCAKNLTDSEHLMRQLTVGGWDVRFESEEPADVAIVNTCGFIADAKEESVDTILALVEAKKSGQYSRVVVFGCLSQRYLDELKEEIPEVDAFFGVNDLNRILETLNTSFNCAHAHERSITTPSHYAYLKISEGCNRKCSFCIIPSIRGRHISVPADTLINEAQYLSKLGVKELLLVAQDLSSYGTDFKKHNALAELLSELEGIQGIEWIRLHYAYPAGFPIEIIPLIAHSEKIVNYLDIPLQHASDRILKLMKRGHTVADSQALINRLRNEIPDIALRTTFITGFPSETEAEHQQVLEFIERNRFDRLGVFTYSEEEGTYAASLNDDVPAEVKERRYSEILDLQEKISFEKNQGYIGHVMKVIIDRHELGNAIGRTQYDSPEVDQEVIINSNMHLKPGDFIDVMITDAGPFELFAAYHEFP